jgi:hypothetical protein
MVLQTGGSGERRALDYRIYTKEELIRCTGTLLEISFMTNHCVHIHIYTYTYICRTQRKIQQD